MAPHSRQKSNSAFTLQIDRFWSYASLGLTPTPKRQRQLRYGNPILRARLYEAAMAEQPGSYRDIARRFQVTREEVCHYLTLVRRLRPDLLAVVEHEQQPDRMRAYSLRRLLRIARLPHGDQPEAFEELRVPGEAAA